MHEISMQMYQINSITSETHRKNFADVISKIDIVIKSSIYILSTQTFEELYQ